MEGGQEFREWLVSDLSAVYDIGSWAAAIGAYADRLAWLSVQDPDRFLEVAVWWRWCPLALLTALGVSTFFAIRDSFALRKRDGKLAEALALAQSLTSELHRLAPAYEKRFLGTLSGLVQRYEEKAFNLLVSDVLGLLQFHCFGGSRQDKESFMVVRSQKPPGLLEVAFTTQMDNEETKLFAGNVLDTWICGVALQQAQPLVIEVTAASQVSTTAGWVIPHCKSVALAPLRVGTLEGVLGVKMPLVGVFSDEIEVTYLRYLADVVSIALSARSGAGERSDAKGV